VIAVGTTVVRALEGAALVSGGRADVVATAGETDLRIGPDHRLLVVHGLVSGLHDPQESHFQLLRAFADEPLLLAAHTFARDHGFHSHELGDTMLILPTRPAAPLGQSDVWVRPVMRTGR
jgi:S-adenosylmethionine:tRNA ribosyltransferase-isomerase